MSSKWEDLWGLLTNVSKLERDKGVQQWEHVVSHKEDEGVKKGMESQIQSFAQKAAVTNEEMAWETKLGFLLAAKIAAGHLGSSDYLVAPALLYLTDSEVRVRLAAGELLGELCKVQGPQVYEKVKDDVLNLIKTNLERDMIENENNGSSSSRGSPEPRSSPVKMTGSKFAENIFHDTAGWKNLETSMECLRRMVEGLGPKFAPFLDQAMIQLIQVSLGHTNRFVRETGYYTLTSFIQTGTLTEKSDAPDSAGKFGPLFADSISLGLADNWSQVRLSASVACRYLICVIHLN